MEQLHKRNTFFDSQIFPALNVGDFLFNGHLHTVNRELLLDIYI